MLHEVGAFKELLGGSRLRAVGSCGVFVVLRDSGGASR